MSWSYRLVQHENQVGSRVDHVFAIHEVYYDHQGKVWGFNRNPIKLHVYDHECEKHQMEPQALLAYDLAQMHHDIQKWPPIKKTQIPEEGAVVPQDWKAPDVRSKAAASPNPHDDQAGVAEMEGLASAPKRTAGGVIHESGGPPTPRAAKPKKPRRNMSF